MQEYIKILENPTDKNTHIRIELSYDLGGMNYFTGKVKKRGYYLLVYPVERSKGMESFVAFTGVSELLIECKRKSAKAEAEALQRLPAYKKIMVDYIANKHGYILEV